MIEIDVDLRDRFGPARDQGSRPTCLAFATSDLHAGLRDGWFPLSCEFVFYHAQRRSGRGPSQGASLGPMLQALKLDGQPLEGGWPYLSALPAELSQWSPPASVGPCFARDGGNAVAALDAIKAAHDQGDPMMILMTLSASFFQPTADSVVDPSPTEIPDAALRHAVVAVGYGRVDGVPAILVRNSWGQSWGMEGHAWLTERFLKPRLFAAAELGDDVDVSSGFHAA